MGTVPPDALQAAVDMLVTKLSNKGGHSALEEATRQLALLSECDANKCVIAKSPGAFFSLVNLLFVDVGENVQEFAVRALGNLARSPENGNLITGTRVLDGLVPLLAENTSEALQSRAAWAMSNLAMLPENVNFIATYPGALQAIEEQFGNHLRSNAQQKAARTIANIAALCTVPGILNQMLSRILPTLEELLYKDEAPYVQFHVLRAFKYLARSPPNKLKIRQKLGVAGGICRLIASLADEAIQEQAATALQVVYGT